MQKEISKTGYWFALIAGWLNLGVGFYLLYEPVMKIYEFYVENNIEVLAPSYYIIGIAFYFLIMGIWIIYYAKFFRSVFRDFVKRAGIACFILGILSLNIVSVIAGAIGIVKGAR